MGCVYAIENRINGKKYVGVTSRSLEIRKEEHIHRARLLRGAARSPLVVIMAKTGVENFGFFTLWECQTPYLLRKAESYFILKMGTLDEAKGYNRILELVRWEDKRIPEPQLPVFMTDFETCIHLWFYLYPKGKPEFIQCYFCKASLPWLYIKNAWENGEGVDPGNIIRNIETPSIASRPKGRWKLLTPGNFSTDILDREWLLSTGYAKDIDDEHREFVVREHKRLWEVEE